MDPIGRIQYPGQSKPEQSLPGSQRLRRLYRTSSKYFHLNQPHRIISDGNSAYPDPGPWEKVDPEGPVVNPVGPIGKRANGNEVMILDYPNGEPEKRWEPEPFTDEEPGYQLCYASYRRNPSLSKDEIVKRCSEQKRGIVIGSRPAELMATEPGYEQCYASYAREAGLSHDQIVKRCSRKRSVVPEEEEMMPEEPGYQQCYTSYARSAGLTHVEIEKRCAKHKIRALGSSEYVLNLLSSLRSVQNQLILQAANTLSRATTELQRSARISIKSSFWGREAI